MGVYQLTIDTSRLSGERADVREMDFPGHAPLIAAWTTLFGPLNQTYLLQPLAAETSIDRAVPPRLPQMHSRVIQLLDAPIRSFDPDGGRRRPLHELRRYDLAPGGAEPFLALLREILDHRERLSPCLGAWRSLSGNTDQVLHLWSYADLDERDAVRERLIADPAWKAYSAAVIPLILRQENVLLKPLVGFS